MTSPMKSSGVVDFDGHHRLKERRLGAVGCVLERHGSGDLERQFRGVDVVVRAVEEVTLTSTMGYPARTPFSIASWQPASTEGMYSRGMRPPVTLFSNR